jgi:hypothetical protein
MPPGRRTLATGSTRRQGSGRSNTARSTGSSSGSPSSTGRMRTIRLLTSPSLIWMLASARRQKSSRCS